MLTMPSVLMVLIVDFLKRILNQIVYDRGYVIVAHEMYTLRKNHPSPSELIDASNKITTESLISVSKRLQ